VESRRTRFAGWRILAVACTVNAFAWSTRASFAAVYAAMLQDLGWSRTQAVLGYALSWLALVPCSPLAGWLYDHLGPRVVVPLGGLALALGVALTGHIVTPAQYYLSYGGLVGFGIAATLGPSSALLSRWFVRRRGTALGLYAAGSSVGTLLSLPLVAWLVAASGWRATLAGYGAVLALTLTLPPLLVYRDSPEALGQEPDGGRGPAPARVRITSEHPWTVRAALGTVTFWAAFAMLLLGVVAFQIVTTHQVAFAVNRGIRAERAAAAFGLVGVFQLLGNLTGGTLSDRLGRQFVFQSGSVLGLVAVVVLTSVDGPADFWKLYLFALFMGLGFGARISLLSAIPADAFGGPRFGAILGLLQIGSGLGGFVGPTLAGLIYDASDSYRVAFLTAGAAVLLSGLAAWFARPPRVPAPAEASRAAS
jgi:MFS family permease